MPIDQEILRQAKENPADVRFEDIMKLAAQLGWEPVGGKGSHRVFRHPNATMIKDRYPRPLNLQCGRNGKAKAYQVRQLLAMAREMGIIDKEETE